MPFMAAAAPIAKVAAPFILKGIGKLFGNRGKKKALQEQQRAEQEQINNKFRSDSDRFDNMEDDRLMRAQGIAQQLKGARALSPEVIAAAMQRRRNTAYKGSVVDQTKGMGSKLIGEGFNAVGDIAGNMLREKAIGEAEQGMSPDYAPDSGGIPSTLGQLTKCPDGSYSGTGC